VQTAAILLNSLVGKEFSDLTFHAIALFVRQGDRMKESEKSITYQQCE
jgi:hypothetical protein